MSSPICRHLHRAWPPRRCAAVAAAARQSAPRRRALPGVAARADASVRRTLAAHNGRRIGLPGQGGASEERAIARAVRAVGDLGPPVVVEVMNACHVDWAARRLPSRNLLRRGARLWVRVLTHADLLGEEALRRQMERAAVFFDNEREGTMGGANENGEYRMPVIALNLGNVDSGRIAKRLRPVKELLLGAKMVAHHGEQRSKSILVCGLPNAGKSSFIYPLTKQRTMNVKKKKGHHLPKINATAGWTLGTKSHAFEITILKDSKNGGKHHKKETVSLTDMPGMRPRLDDISPDTEELAHWLATCSLKPQKGDLSQTNEDAEATRRYVLDVLWRGMRRHAELSDGPFRFESPEDLWECHVEASDDGSAALHHLIQACHWGRHGPLIVEDENTRIMVQRYGTPSEYGLMHFNPENTVVAMNDAAEALVEVGTARRAPGAEKNARLFLPRPARDWKADERSSRKARPNSMRSGRPQEDGLESQIRRPQSRENNKEIRLTGKVIDGNAAGIDATTQPLPKYHPANSGPQEDELTSYILGSQVGGNDNSSRPVGKQSDVNAAGIDATALPSRKHAPISSGSRENKLDLLILGPQFGENDEESSHTNKQFGGSAAGINATTQPSPKYAPLTKGDSATVYTRNLNCDVDREATAIDKTSKGCDEIVKVRLAKTHLNRVRGSTLRGSGDINFAHPRSTRLAVELSGSLMTGHPIQVDSSKKDAKAEDRVVRLPEHQRRLDCMKCAGFIRANRLGDLFGTQYPRVINWDEGDIRSFFSRMTEAFGGNKSRHMRYLMKDSLVLTLKNKHRLSSRRKVYKKYGKALGGYPVRNKDRPRRFRSDWPVPLAGPIVCTGQSKGACRFSHEVLASMELRKDPGRSDGTGQLVRRKK